MLQAQIFLDKDDQYEGRPVYEYVMRYLMHHDIAGATLFRADMGYGVQHHLHAPGRIGAMDERPLLITFVDTQAKVRAVLEHLRTIVRDGLIISSSVEIWNSPDSSSPGLNGISDV